MHSQKCLFPTGNLKLLNVILGFKVEVIIKKLPHIAHTRQLLALRVRFDYFLISPFSVRITVVSFPSLLTKTTL